MIESKDDDLDSKKSTIESGTIELEPSLNLSRALFATILPGITSDPTGPGHDVPDEILAEDPRYGRRGMGLYILINAVVEVLEGSVSFRAGRHFMFVRKTNKKEYKETGAAIRVRVKERPAHVPEFRGNLVTVRARLPQGG